jgi:putative transcriptional regulator
MQEAKLYTGQDKFEVALHKICAGGVTPKHDHRGLEYTVVLKGSFSDEKSVYAEGDFITREPGDVHQPMGAKNGECICLSAQEAPIRLTSILGLFLNPWLRVKPS